MRQKTYWYPIMTSFVSLDNLKDMDLKKGRGACFLHLSFGWIKSMHIWRLENPWFQLSWHFQGRKSTAKNSQFFAPKIIRSLDPNCRWAHSCHTMPSCLSHPTVVEKMSFLFHCWDMLVPKRVWVYTSPFSQYNSSPSLSRFPKFVLGSSDNLALALSYKCTEPGHLSRQ